MSHLPTPASPFKGLAAFEDSAVDALFFFGRDRDSQVIAANLIASRLTVLFGATGVGKTSILRAGVAYRLRREVGVEVLIHSSWTADPVQGLIEATGHHASSLADALSAFAKPGAEDLYLILDQFEEYFLYHERDRTLVQQLTEVLKRPGLRVNVLIGIREDTLAFLDAFKAEIPNLLSNRLRLQRLDRVAGEAAILGPVRRFNELVPEDSQMTVDPQLVPAVLDEVAAGRVELGGVGRGVVRGSGDTDRIEAPFLQLVMSRLWDVEREAGSRVLHHDTLRDLGGAAQIVHDHLDRSMARLSPRQKDAAAAMYNFLVTPSGSKIAHGVSDLAGYAEIGEDEAIDVLRRLTDERIVRANVENGAATRYEIYHDVLADAVAAWRNRHRAERALHEAEHRRRRAFMVATVALLGLVLVAAIAVFALVERSSSNAHAQRAHARELAAAARSTLDENPQRSIELALQAAELERGAHEEDVLRDALLSAHQRAVLRAAGPVGVARFDPVGRHIVTGSKDGKVRVYRAGSSTPVRVLDQGAPVTAVAYSNDGRLILTAGRDGTARIFGESDSPLRQLVAGGPVTTALFASRSQRVLTITRNGLIRLWRTNDGRLLRTIIARGKALPKGGAVSPGGKLLITFGQDRFARMYSLLTGLLLGRLEHKGLVHCVSFNPNGSAFLSCSHEGVIKVWSTETLQKIRTLRGPEPGSAIVDGVFSPNGFLVAGAVTDGTARVWEAQTGFQIGVLFGHTNPTTVVAFSPTGNAIATGSSDTRARTWLASGRPVAMLAGHGGRINGVDFSADGRAVVTASADGTARLWDSATEPQLALVARQTPITSFALDRKGGRVIVGDVTGIAQVRSVGRRRALRSIRLGKAVTAVAFGPKGPIVATTPTLSLAVSQGSGLVARGMRDGSVVLRRPAGRTRVLRAGTKPITAVALNSDGFLLASGNTAGVVRLWNLRSGGYRAIIAHALGITSLAFSPDGRLLLTASRDGEARTWNVASGALVHKLKWHFGPLGGAAFSPDGRWIITAGPSTAAIGSVATGRRLMFLRAGLTRPLVGAAFGGSSGRLVVTASKDGTIRFYRCDICGGVDELIRLARRRLGLN